MGNSTYTLRQPGFQNSDPRAYLQNDLARFIHLKTIGTGKFMKAHQMKVDGTPCVVKIYLRNQEEDLNAFASELTRIYELIPENLNPNNFLVTSWNWVILTDFASFKPVLIPDDDPNDFQYYFDAMNRHRCYLAPERFYSRQLYASVYMPTPPPGKDAGGASMDASILPSDPLESFLGRDPALAVSMLRERDPPFPPSTSTSPSPTTQTDQAAQSSSVGNNPLSPSLTEAMDIFSLGCTIAEVLLDGEPLLDLPKMLRYRLPSSPPDTPSGPGGYSGGYGCNSLEEKDSPACAAMGRIRDRVFRKIVGEMTRKLPEDRASSLLEIRETLQAHGVFPEYFSTVLYTLFMRLHREGVTPDDKVLVICENYGRLTEAIAGHCDTEGALFFESALLAPQARPSKLEVSDDQNGQDFLHHNGYEDIQTTTSGDLGAEDFKGASEVSKTAIELLFLRCEKMIANIENEVASLFTQENSPNTSHETYQTHKYRHGRSTVVSKGSFENQAVEGVIDDLIETLEDATRVNSFSIDRRDDRIVSEPGLLLIIQCVCTVMAHLRHPRSKMMALALLLRLGIHSPDEDLLQRVIPHIITLLEDMVASVRALAIRCLRVLLSRVKAITALESEMCPLYIFPALSRLSQDPEITVRIALAESIGIFAECSRRFLELSHHLHVVRILEQQRRTDPGEGDRGFDSKSNTPTELKATPLSGGDGSEPISIIESHHDRRLKSLQDTISQWIKDLTLVEHQSPSQSLLSQSSTFVIVPQSPYHSSAHIPVIKRLILANISKLCVFFGQEGVVERLLPLLLTFLTDQDWELRQAFFMHISALCAFCGPSVTTAYVVPLLIPAITDVQDVVIAEAVTCMRSIMELNLLPKQLVHEVVGETCALLLHPFSAIRAAMHKLIEAAASNIGHLDSYVFLFPLLKGFLKFDLLGIPMTAKNLELACVEPLSREVFSRELQRQETLLSTQRQQEILEESSDVESPFLAVDPKDLMDETASDDNKDILKTPHGKTNEQSTDGISKSQVLAPYLQLVSKERNRSIRLYGDTRETLKPRLSKSFNQFSITSFFNVSDQLAHSFFIPRQKYVPIVSASAEMRYKALYLLELLSSENAMIGSEVVDVVKTRNERKQSEDLSVTTRSVADDQVTPATVTEYLTQSEFISMFGVEIPKSSLEAAVVRFSGSGTPEGLAGASESLESLQLARRHTSFSNHLYGTNISTSDARQFEFLLRQKLEKISEDIPKSNKKKTCDWLWTFYGISESRQLLHRFKALGVPPLSSDFGSLRQPDGRYFSVYTDALDCSMAIDGSQRSSVWKPRESALVATLMEHTHSVNRLAVAADHSFFASASDDKTVKIWQLSGIDKMAFPRSSFTYSGHQDRVLDVASIENSHSIASCSADGEVHVWRVDVGLNSYQPNANTASAATTAMNTNRGYGLRVRGLSTINMISLDEGPVISVAHFNSDVASIVVFVSLRGVIHGWDLRSSVEVFNIILKPEYGYPTAFCISPDHHWICVGTAYGYICLWDIRFNRLCKLWQHSSLGQPIHRLSCCDAMSSSGKFVGQNHNSDSLLFVSAGQSEVGVWRVPDGGECIKCFRSLPLSPNRTHLAPLPSLQEISTLPLMNSLSRPDTGRSQHFSVSVREPSVRSMLGRFPAGGPAHLITGGTDKNIRYWDFSTPIKCYTVAGVEPSQPKPTYEAPVGSDLQPLQGRLFVCYDLDAPSSDVIIQAHKPLREGRGPVPPANGFKDAILDLKCVDLPMRMLLSSSRDGQIKLWR